MPEAAPDHNAHALHGADGLRALLWQRRTAALGTVDDAGQPAVSMVPFALATDVGVLVLHVSALAAHTGHLRKRPQAALMVTASETPGQPVHALPRLSLQVQARLLSPQDADWPACRAAYLARFPDAEPMTHLADFCFAALQPIAGRHVAGFGAARSVDAPTLRDALTPPNP